MFVTHSYRGQQYQEAVKTGTGQSVEVVANVHEALCSARRTDYEAIIIDESAAELEGAAIGALLKHAGSAVPIFVNLALCGAERVGLEVRAALRRRERDKAAARASVLSELRDALRGEVTGILLNSELALEVRSLPVAAESRIKQVCDLAYDMKRALAM